MADQKKTDDTTAQEAPEGKLTAPTDQQDQQAQQAVEETGPEPADESKTGGAEGRIGKGLADAGRKARDVLTDFFHTNFLHEAHRAAVRTHVIARKPMHVSFALTHANVIDLIADPEHGTVHADQTIVVNPSGNIESIGPSADIDPSLPATCYRIDTHGRYVMPGLINAHTHTFSDGRPSSSSLSFEQAHVFFQTAAGREASYQTSRRSVEDMLESGVTTLRTLGDVNYENVRLRDRIAGGRMVGPRMMVSGPMLAIPGGHGVPLASVACEDVDAARTHALENLDAGCDALKIAATGGVSDAKKVGNAGTPQMTVEQMQAICDVAHERGVLVAAHCQSPEGVLNALKAGVDTIEHGAAMDEETIELYKHNPNALRGWSAVDPTLIPALVMDRLPLSVTGITEVVQKNSLAVTDGMIQSIRQAHENGIALGFGTDSAMPMVTQYSTWHELDYRVRFAGESRAQALFSATEGNARILGLEKVTGSLEKGLSADLLVLNGNPLEDLRTLDKPAMVVAAGSPVFRPMSTIKRFDDIDADLDSII